MYPMGQLGRRLAQKHGATFGISRRAYSTEASRTGNILTDEEKAAENLYIKKMEQERLEKMKKAQQAQHAQTQQAATESSAPSGGGSATAQKATDNSTTVAVFGGLTAMALGGYFFLRTEAKKEEET